MRTGVLCISSAVISWSRCSASHGPVLYAFELLVYTDSFVQGSQLLALPCCRNTCTCNWVYHKAFTTLQIGYFCWFLFTCAYSLFDRNLCCVLVFTGWNDLQSTVFKLKRKRKKEEEKGLAMNLVFIAFVFFQLCIIACPGCVFVLSWSVSNLTVRASNLIVI